MIRQHRMVAGAMLILMVVSMGTTGRARADRASATLRIRVVDLRNRKGDLIFGVFDQPRGFPNVKESSINWQVKPAGANPVEFTVQLPPGKYAASVLHDENRNGKMDRDIAGIPLEGYGVTNNPKPTFRQATFKEALFTLPADGATLTISIQYFR